MISVKPENGRIAFPRFGSWLDNFMENEFPSVTQSEHFKTPALVNVRETTDSYRLEVAAPGFAKENFNVKVENGLLTISGESKHTSESEGEKFTRKEYNFTSFNRSFTLPKTVDAEKIAATYENGILTVALPKQEEAKAKGAIEVKVA